MIDSKKEGQMRKFLFITLSIIFAFITLGQAGEIYKCTDRHGNLFITSSPRDGMKCDLRESFEESASKGGAEEEKAVTKNDKSAAALEKERLARIINATVAALPNSSPVTIIRRTTDFVPQNLQTAMPCANRRGLPLQHGVIAGRSLPNN